MFVCPVSGRIRAKLYSSQDQFPSVLYQVLQEIEGEGYVCRELYCDTSAVNISAAARRKQLRISAVGALRANWSPLD